MSPASHLNCLPSPCNRLSRSRTTTEAPLTGFALGDHPLASNSVFPSSSRGLYAWARLPIAVFVLACCQSFRRSLPSDALSETGSLESVGLEGFQKRTHTCPSLPSGTCLVSRVGRGDISTLRCVSIGSCSSTVPSSA